MKFVLKTCMVLFVLGSISTHCSDQIVVLKKPTLEEIHEWARLVDASGMSRLHYVNMSQGDILNMLVSNTSSSTTNREALCALIDFETKHPNIACCKTIGQQDPASLGRFHAEVCQEKLKEEMKIQFAAKRAAMAARRQKKS